MLQKSYKHQTFLVLSLLGAIYKSKLNEVIICFVLCGQVSKESH
jgi:hypothetical protein